MAGINPATGLFDPYYYGNVPATSSTQYTTEASRNGTLRNLVTFYNVAAPGGSWSATPTAATPTATQQQEKPVDPYAAYLDAMRKEQAAALERQRTSAFDTMQSILAGFGIDTSGTGLAATIKNWVWQDKPTEWIKVELRKTAEYNKRFPGMADLIKRGQFMDEATYIAQERAYRAVLNGWNLPTGFYDDPSDFGRFIANGVSAKELDDRVRSAKTFLDSANPAYKSALNELYGVGEGGMLAYVLDGDRAQSILTRQFKEAATLGAAESKGRFDLTADQAAKYAGTLGQQYDVMGVDQVNSLEQTMAQLGQMADQDERLSAIDQTAYNRTDALDAGLMNDTAKQLASQKRAERERNRFRGSTAVTTGTLARGGRV